MKVIVTGSTIMIGVALIENCINNGIEVLDTYGKNTNRISRLPKSDLVKIQFCNLDELNIEAKGDTYDVFYHFAWDYTSKNKEMIL